MYPREIFVEGHWHSSICRYTIYLSRRGKLWTQVHAWHCHPSTNGGRFPLIVNDTFRIYRSAPCWPFLIWLSIQWDSRRAAFYWLWRRGSIQVPKMQRICKPVFQFQGQWNGSWVQSLLLFKSGARILSISTEWIWTEKRQTRKIWTAVWSLWIQSTHHVFHKACSATNLCFRDRCEPVLSSDRILPSSHLVNQDVPRLYA